MAEHNWAGRLGARSDFLCSFAGATDGGPPSYLLLHSVATPLSSTLHQLNRWDG